MKFFFGRNPGSFYQQIKVMALLGYNYNSFHQLTYRSRDLLDGEMRDLVVINQFIAANKRHPTDRLDVGRWRLPVSGLYRRLAELRSFELYGEAGGDVLDFYFPLDLGDEYERLFECLGPPEKTDRGILTPSGRSIWVLSEDRAPVCLKVDTMQLRQRKFFSERLLGEQGLRHTMNVTAHLHAEDNIFTEARGASFTFGYPDPDGRPMQYNFLIRELRPEAVGLRPDDSLVPVVALLSEKLWAEPALLKSLGLPSSPARFLIEDFARALAAMIRNSLDRTFVHFEIHQQNLTLLVREKRGEKLLYHDLQDTVLDPVSLFLDRLKQCGGAEIGRHYAEVYGMQRQVCLNSHGHLVTHDFSTKEHFNIVSLYRRYLRNFGHYTRTYNFFAGEDYVNGRDFETAVLRHLNFTSAELETTAPPELAQDLFWHIDRYQRRRQRRELASALAAYRQSCPGPADRVSPEELLTLLGREDMRVIHSGEFPVHIRLIDAEQLTEIENVYHRKVFFARYAGEPVLLLLFQYI